MCHGFCVLVSSRSKKIIQKYRGPNLCIFIPWSLVTHYPTALFNPQKVVNFFKTFCSAINHPKSGRHRPGMVLHLSARLALRLALAGSLMGGAWAGQTETRMALLNLGLPIMPKGGGTMGKTIRSGDLVRLHSELHTALRRETGGTQGCGPAPAAPPRPALRTSAPAVHLPSLPCLFCGVAARACARGCRRPRGTSIAL